MRFIQWRDYFPKREFIRTLAYGYSLTFSKYSSDPSGLGLMVGEFSLQLAGQTSPCFSTNWKALTSLIVSSTDLPTAKRKKNKIYELVSYKKQFLGIWMSFWGHKKKWARFSKISCLVDCILLPGRSLIDICLKHPYVKREEN